MWVLPTYKRPERCQIALDAFARNGSTKGIVVCDGPMEGYERLKLPKGWNIERLPENLGVIGVLNWFYEKFPSEDWYGFISDDCVAETDGFDKALVDRAGKTGIASANDEWQAPKRTGACVVIGGDLVRTWGFFAPPVMKHSCCDDFWELVGRDFGIWHVLMGVVVRHDHAWNEKAANDEGYHKAYSTLNQDRAAYAAWLATHRDRLWQKIAKTTGKKVRAVDLSGKKIAFGTPCYGGMIARTYFDSFIKTIYLLNTYRVDYYTITSADQSMVHRARNNIVRSFYFDTDATHLLFIDADMGWEADSVLRLLAADKDIVAGAGPRKMTPVTFCARMLENGERDKEAGCIEVENIGTGFMMISRECITKMMNAYPQTKYRHIDGKDYWGLFYPEIRDGLEWSEDYTFCHRWRQINGKVWCEPTIRLDHVGPHTWSGALSDTAKQKEVSDYVGASRPEPAAKARA